VSPLVRRREPIPLAGRRVLITGAARGIGAETARRLHGRGARLALAGLEAELLEEVAAQCGGAPVFECDVSDRAAVEAAVDGAADALGGLDVVMANAGIAAQLPIVGGDPAVFEKTQAVNVLGVYYTVRAAGPHIAHPGGYALLIASLAAAVHAPLLGAYNASKAAVEALGNTLRVELKPSGARVGVGYFAEIDTDMTSRGFGTEAAKEMLRGRPAATGVAPLHVAINAVERGIERRSRRVCAPAWVELLLPTRMIAQRAIDLAMGGDLERALQIARDENAPFTTQQPDRV
jgi:NAD(P)-dependent dehydrogenase (short-subunit alcohol dehydrogenase family)